MADSDSDERVSLFLFASNLAQKIISQTDINSVSKKLYFPHPTLFTSQGHKCQGKEQGLSQKKEVIQEEEDLDRGTGVVPSWKRRQSSQKHTKVGGR